MGEQRLDSWREADTPARAEFVDVLFRRHYSALLRLGVVMLGSREAAEDAVQDAFVALHRHRRSLRDPEAAEAYLRAAVLNRCRSWVRRQVTQRATRPLMLVRDHQESPEDTTVMASIGAGVVIGGLLTSVVFTRVVGSRIRERARLASKQQDPGALPEQ